LLITGGRVVIQGDIVSVKVLDCTVLAGVVIQNDNVALTMERCITGPLTVHRGSTAELTRCIIDAKDPSALAYREGALKLLECTVIGRIDALMLTEVTDSILYATGAVPVRAERTQTGCVRYSYIPWGSQAPRRYRCRPESAQDATRIHVQFTSRDYGSPAYCQLSRATSAEILRGASDESEMGVYHDLFAPQRDASLRLRLQEFLRHGLEAGIYYET
jgi:hypothetical protein